MSKAEDVERLQGRLQQMLPCLPRDVGKPTAGDYAAIDAGGPAVEGLVATMYKRSDLGAGVWERYAHGILNAAQETVFKEVEAFNLRALESGSAAMQALGPWDPRSNEIMNILTLFENKVGRDVANETWQMGYAGALGVDA